jgi:hypothetical protein
MKKSSNEGEVRNTTTSPSTVTKPAPLNKPEARCAAGSVDDFYDKAVCNWGEFPTGQALINLTKDGSHFTDYTRPDDTALKLEMSGGTARYNLPGGVVLAAMKDLFDKYRKVIEALAAAGSSYPWPGNPITDLAGYAGVMTSCVNTGYSPMHWNDIQIHYYCIGIAARGCYTLLAGDDKFTRRTAFAACSTFNGKMSTDVSTLTLDGVAFSPITHDGSANTLNFESDKRGPGAADWMRMYKGVELDPTKPKIPFLDGKFTYTDPSGNQTTYEHADVFRYLMLARTFAFDDPQQNRVINEFWAYVRSSKPASGPTGGEWDVPAGVSGRAPASCNFRPRRALSETSGDLHCIEGERYDSISYGLEPLGR